MRRYETIFILRPNVGEDEITRIIESTTQIILGQEGTIIELNKWGMKKLAYLIKKETLGYYVYCDYAGTPAAVAEIERKFRIDDSVLKYMTIKTADALSEEEVQQAVAAVSEKQSALADEDLDSTEDSEATDATADATSAETEEK
jgi:small subunit ribosomal protein S6